MAMAGQGLNAQPPPRPASHNYFGSSQNPGNQLYVGNVSDGFFFMVMVINEFLTAFFFFLSLFSFLTKLVGRI